MKININNEEIDIDKPKLKQWLQLEDLRKVTQEAVIRKDISRFYKSVLDYLITAFDKEESFFSSLTWQEFFGLFDFISGLCYPEIKFPFVMKGNKKDEKPDWDYLERTWFYWSNIFAKQYGWTLDQIANLEFQDALGLLQEIMVDEQLEREWAWRLSEIAYPYNEGTKKQQFKPLERPAWMVKIKEQPKIKMRKDHLPMGNVLKYGEDEN